MSGTFYINLSLFIQRLVQVYCVLVTRIQLNGFGRVLFRFCRIAVFYQICDRKVCIRQSLFVSFQFSIYITLLGMML